MILINRSGKGANHPTGNLHCGTGTSQILIAKYPGQISLLGSLVRDVCALSYSTKGKNSTTKKTPNSYNMFVKEAFVWSNTLPWCISFGSDLLEAWVKAAKAPKTRSKTQGVREGAMLFIIWAHWRAAKPLERPSTGNVVKFTQGDTTLPPSVSKITAWHCYHLMPKEEEEKWPSEWRGIYACQVTVTVCNCGLCCCVCVRLSSAIYSPACLSLDSLSQSLSELVTLLTDLAVE